ncbi:MAG: response regulator [Ignavibacteriae bacterium]|nr:response regulator [Ignavibacteriota bacterium]
MSAKHKILIVDDKEQNLVALEKVLTECDAEVVKATSGNEALTVSLSEDFALAILDVNMPDMNGYELAGYLAGAEKTKNLPIIFLSAEYSDDMHILKAYESGGIDFVAKPFNPYYLLSKVNVFLKLDRQKNELLDKIEIEKSKNYLESILMSVNDFIIVISLDGSINVINNVTLTRLDYSFRDLYGKKIINLFTEEIKNQIEDTLKEYDKPDDVNNLKHFKTETILRKKNNVEMPIILSMTPLISDFGTVHGAVLVGTDITERIIIEEELRIAKEKAEEVSKIKSNFLANMSHELRTPMVGILGFSELLSNTIADEEQRHFAEIIHKGGTRLMETLNLILDISLIESNKLNLTTQEFNLISLAEEAIKLFEKVALKKGLCLKIDSDKKDFIIKQDIGLVRQILNNLINNAVKFTEKGGATIILRKEIYANKEYAAIKVKDTGIGIPDDKLNLIWEEFRQVSEGLGRSFEGTGLGLSLTKKFTEKLGGQITIEDSELGKGTTFKVLLPVELNNINEPQVSDTGTNSSYIDVTIPGSEKPNILYVEDDLDAALLVKTNAKNMCNIDIISTGEEAVEVVKNKKYTAVLMDINLGTGMNGINTADEIRKITGYENVPIVAITAFAMVGDKEEFMEKGFTSYLSKPFVRAELLSFIKDILTK